jgi:hypothetical protein
MAQEQLTQKVELIKGQEYSVEIYPTDTVVKAKYLGKNKLEGFGDRHLFISGEGREKGYIAMDNHWLEKNENGIITYTSLSSAPVLKINKENLKKKLNSENIHDKDFGLRILKFLESFGEQI